MASPLQQAEKRRELKQAQYNLSTWHQRLAQVDAEVQQALDVEGACLADVRDAESRVWLAMHQPGAVASGPGDVRLPGQEDVGDPGAPWAVKRAKAVHEAATAEAVRAGIARQERENERNRCLLQISGLGQLVSRLDGELRGPETPGYALAAGRV